MKYELWIGNIASSRYSWILVKSSHLLHNNCGVEVEALVYSCWKNDVYFCDRSSFLYVMDKNYTKIK